MSNGTNLIETLDKIKSLKGHKKLSHLSSNSDLPLLKTIWHLAYGGHVFNTAKLFPLGPYTDTLLDEPEAVIQLLGDLESRKYTGNEAKARIATILEGLNADCVDLYNRIIKKNLKCGIGIAAGNEVWGEDFIWIMPVMLVSPHCNKKAMKIINSGSAVLQLKSDGVRGLVESNTSYTSHPTGMNNVNTPPGFDKHFACYRTRQGEHLVGFAEVWDSRIQALIHSVFGDAPSSTPNEPFSLDGEFCIVDENGVHNFSAASGILGKAIDGTATVAEIESLTYIIWDLYGYGENSTEEYGERIQDLDWHCKAVDGIEFVPTWKVTTIEEVHAKYREIVKAGNEGVILKSLDNIWSATRVTDCIKYKEKHQTELMIASWYYGESGKEFQNVLGGYTVESECGMVRANSGSGLKEIDRGILMDANGKALKDDNNFYIPSPNLVENLELRVGKITTIEYNQRTLAEGSQVYSLRFPIFKGIRIDKTEADTMETMVQQESASYGLRT